MTIDDLDFDISGDDTFTPLVEMPLSVPMPGEDEADPPARGLGSRAWRRINGGQKTRRLRRRTGSDPDFMGSFIRDAEVGHHSKRNRGRKPRSRK